MTGRVLLRGGCVLTLGTRTPNYSEADVLIEGGRIAEVGPGLRARDAEVVDATDTIVMPGFVDGHRHASTSLLRNIDVDGSPAEMPASDLQPEDVYAATLISLLTAAASGTTSVVDWSDVPPDDAYGEASLQAHADSGLRTVLVSDSHRAGSAGALPATTTLAAASPEPAGDTIEATAATWAKARASGMRIHAHAGMTAATAGAVAEIGRRGLLGGDVTLVHCTHLDHADLDAVSSSRAAVVLTPASEMATGLGAPPMQRLIDRSIRPGLGVDAERIAPGDMFAPMRTAISIQHATVFDLKLVGKGGIPKLLTTREVIRYATSDGARAVGLEASTGSLEAGKQADVIVLRTDRPNIFPVNDPIGAVVWGVDTSNLDWVFVAGRALMRHGSLEGDVERARKLASEAQQRVASSGVVAAGRGEST
jgi:5-methylthioadenosine/S-adenosylhomocysteine deaminase